ncbi:MAG TPA: hypothetical protein V6D18_02050 [Thermosynechococcaceae cyanobacterium]
MLRLQTIDTQWTSQVSSLCYSVSQWDRDAWLNYLAAFPPVQDTVNRGEKRIAGWGLFVEEIFHRLYTLPTPIPYDQLRPEVLWAHELHQHLHQHTDFSEMQLTCRQNQQAAGHGAYRLAELALEQLPKPPKGFIVPAR